MLSHPIKLKLVIVANYHRQAANEYTPKQEIKALVCQYKQLPDWKRKIAQSVINNLLAAEV